MERIPWLDIVFIKYQFIKKLHFKKLKIISDIYERVTKKFD